MAEAETKVLVPRALLEKLIDARVDAEPRDSRLVLMAQNPAANFHWSRPVAKVLTAGDIQDLTACLAARAEEA